jgi:hypothetical protein
MRCKPRQADVKLLEALTCLASASPHDTAINLAAGRLEVIDGLRMIYKDKVILLSPFNATI